MNRAKATHETGCKFMLGSFTILIIESHSVQEIITEPEF